MSKCLTLLSLLAQAVMSQVTSTFVIRELFATTASSNSLFWSGAVSSAIGQSTLASNNQHVQCMASVSRPTDGNQLRCTAFNGQLLARFDVTGMALTYSLAIKKNGRVVAAGALNSKLVEFQLTQNAGAYALTQIYDIGTYPAGTCPSGGVDRPNTAFTYFGPYFSGSSGNNQYLYRFESTANTLIRSSSNIAAVTSTSAGVAADTYSVIIWRDTTLITGGAYGAIIFGSLSTLDLLLADTSAGSGKTTSALALDNLNDQFLYHPILQAPFPLRKLDISGASPSQSASVNLGDRPIIGLGNCGTFGYLVAIRTSSTIIKLYDKSTLADLLATYTGTAALRFATAPRASTLLDALSLSPNTFKFSAIANNAVPSVGSSLQSSMIYVDFCETRDVTSFVCSKCKSGYFRNDTASWNECLQPSQFPAGFGSDIANNLMVPCKEGCLSCSGDVNICSNCDRVNSYLYLFKSNTDVSCVKRTSIPLGSGINVAFNLSQVLPCTQEGCVDCTSNKDRCQQCFSFYQLKAGRCDLKSFGLVSKSANPQTRTLVVKLEQKVNPTLLGPADYRLDMMLGLEVSPDQQDVPILSMALLDTQDGYTIRFAPKPSDRGGEYSGLRLSRKTKTQGGVLFMNVAGDAAFTSPEVYFDAVVLAPVDFARVETTGSVMAEVFNWVLKITNFAFRVALMPLEVFVAPIIERQVAYFSFLRHIDGEFVFKPSYIIYWMSSRTFFGFEIKNPHLDWAKTTDCIAPEKMGLAGVRCDLFSNYGQNLNILAAGLVLAGSVWAACYFFAKKGTSPKAGYAIEIIRDSFGLRYAASWFDSVSLDLIGLCILNLPHVSKGNTGLDTGFVVSVIVLTGYACYYSMMSYHIFKYVKTIRKIDSQLDEAKSTDEDVAIFKGPLLAFPLDEYKNKLDFTIFYYTPVIVALKNIILQVIAISMEGSGWGQILPILTIEFGMLLYLSVSLPKASIIDNLYDILIHVINGAYMAVKIGATQVDYQKRQGSFGSGLLIVVFGLLYATTIYVGYKISIGIRRFIKKVRYMKSLSSVHSLISSKDPLTSKNLVQEVKIVGLQQPQQPQPIDPMNSSKLEMAS